MGNNTHRTIAIGVTIAIGAVAGAVIGYFVEHDGTSWGYWISQPLAMKGIWWTLAGGLIGYGVDFARRH